MRYVLLALTATAMIAVVGGCSQSGPPESRLFPIEANANTRCDLGQGWSFRMPGGFGKRVEDGNLLFWREGLTVYAVVWDNDARESTAERLAWIRNRISPDGFETEQAQDGDVLRFAYRLTEHRQEGLVHALYGYTIGPEGHVQMAVYCEREEDVSEARAIWRSIARQGKTTLVTDAHGSSASRQR